MATIFRGQLRVNRREVAPVLALGSVLCTGSLLLTVLKPGLPPGPLKSSARSLPLQVHYRANFNALNLDTSRGMPKTLQAEVRPPQGKAVLQSAPDLVRSVVDTSNVQPLSLTFVAPVQPPFVLAQWPTLPDARRLGVDTSQDMAPVILAALSTPFVAPMQPSLQRPLYQSDTSQDVPKALLPEVALPIGQASPYQAPVRAVYQSDTTTYQAQALGFIAPVQVPFFNPPQSAPARFDRLTDTSSYQPLTLGVVFVQPPFVNLLPAVIQRQQWQAVDTSADMPKALLPEASRPCGTNPPVIYAMPLLNIPQTFIPNFMPPPEVFPTAGLSTDPYHQLGRVHFGPSGIRRR